MKRFQSGNIKKRKTNISKTNMIRKNDTATSIWDIWEDIPLEK